MKKICFISIWLLSIGSAYSGEIVLSGTYLGKAVFVQNPYNHGQGLFCAKEVYVNDRKLFDAPQISAFKIDLSYLKINDLVVIRITFADGCQPRVVNPQVIQSNAQFNFISSQADHNSISWTTVGELPGGHFVVERHQTDQDNWEVIKSIIGRGGQQVNQYVIAAQHHSGENNYRVRYEARDGQVLYSVEVGYTSTVRPITFYPVVATNKLTLSDTAVYAVMDANGKLIKEGKSNEVMLYDLSPGEYYLNIQNRKERFVKK